MNLIQVSTITCPHCQQQTTETMPDDYCQFMYQCQHCGQQLRAKSGDCCVYCSYGNVVCPSKQLESQSSPPNTSSLHRE
ncbi:MAG: GDCCVxC domain-containing (seleno)protein [Anaerolineae bacterium]